MLQSLNTQLVNKTQLTADVYLLKFTLLNPKEINFITGQYVIIKIPTQASFISRLYSIASPSFQKDSIELIIKLVPNGLASNYLLNLKVKDVINVQGPAGGFSLRSNNRDKIFLITGTGIAPVRSMFLTQFNTTNYPSTMPRTGSLLTTNYYLFWGLPTLEDVYLLEELKTLAQKNQNFQLHICLSREKDLTMIKSEDQKFFSLGHIDICFNQQWSSEAMEQSLNSFDFYLCGSREVVESLQQYLLDRGVAKENIYFEKF